jgi:hypothetical protein
VREQQTKPLKESTVGTLLKRSKRKVSLHTRCTAGPLPLPLPRRTAGWRPERRIVDLFRHGSIEEVLVRMVDSDLSLEDFATKLAKAEQQGLGTTYVCSPNLRRRSVSGQSRSGSGPNAVVFERITPPPVMVDRADHTSRADF